MEKHKAVCDKDLRCHGWEEGMKQIVAAQIFYANHAGGSAYTGPLFKFCPWCGKKIIREE
jgi:hypothetical protein